MGSEYCLRFSKAVAPVALLHECRIDRAGQRLFESFPIAWETVSTRAAARNEDVCLGGGVFQRERTNAAHLVQSLRSIVSPDLVGRSFSTFPQFKDECSSGWGVIPAPVNKPVQVERAGDVRDICVVTNEDHSAVPQFPQGSWNLLASHRLLQCVRDMSQRVRCLRSCQIR